MRKLFVMLLVSVMFLTMVGCGESAGISDKNSVNDENITDEIESDLLDSVPENTEVPKEPGKVEKTAAPKDIKLHSYYLSDFELDDYDYDFTWLPKNKDAESVYAEKDSWKLYGGYDSVSMFYVVNAVPQFEISEKDAVSLNQLSSEFMDSIDDDSSLFTFICGDSSDIITVCAEARPINLEPIWLNYGYDYDNKCRISMSEYLKTRGIFETEIIEAVNENAYLLDYLTVPEGVTAEIRLEFDGDYCVMLPTKNTAILRYAVVYHSDSEDVIPYKVGSETFDLKPVGYELQEAFADDLDWFYDGPFVHSVSADMEDAISVWGGLPLLKSDSEDAKKINAQILYNHYGLLSSEVYRRSGNILVLSLLYETTNSSVGHPTYVFNTETETRISAYDYLISLGIDFDSVRELILENDINIENGKIEFEDENGDYSFKFLDEDTVLIFYNMFSSIAIDF